MAESIIGTQCNKGRCGVRLIDLEKLDYHKNHCHDKSGGNDFVCPECLKANIRFTGKLFSKVKLSSVISTTFKFSAKN